jgi:hypothetical protein
LSLANPAGAGEMPRAVCVVPRHGVWGSVRVWEMGAGGSAEGWAEVLQASAGLAGVLG